MNYQFCNIKEHSSNSNQFLISATRDTDNLYEITDSQPNHLSNNRSLKPFCSSTSQPFLCGALKSLQDTSEDDVQPTFSVFQAPVNGEIREIRDFNANQDQSSTETTSDEVDSNILAWNPNTHFLQRHNIAMASYYQSAESPTLRDMVRFFHEAWDHPSRELMIHIVDNKIFTNIPIDLTSTVIRKYFPHCEACPAGNMAQRPIPRTSSNRLILPGEEIQIDIKVFADNSKARKHKRAFGNHTGALTAIDLSTRFKLGKLLRTHKSLEVQLEEIRVEVRSRALTMKVLRIDNEFITQPIKQWAALCDPPIELQPCIPHEHHSIGDIERFNRTLEDAVFKKLYGKPHLSKQYWGLAYLDHIMKSNMVGSIHDTSPSPHELWYGKKPDLLTMPMIPFGSVVMAHVPVAQQTNDGPRSVLHYSVGTSILHQGGLKLFNPQTKREVIRRTFKIIGPTQPSLARPTYELDEANILTETSKSPDTDDASADVNDFKYLIGTTHCDDDDLELYRTVDVVEEVFDEADGPLIVAYRRRLKPNGQLQPKTEDDEYPIHIQDVVKMIADYASLHPDKVPKKTSRKMVNQHR